MSAHRPMRLTRRLRKSPHLLTAAVLAFGVVPAYFAFPASAAVGAGDITTFPAGNITIDSGGPNDINSDQVDLTQMGNDPSHSPYRLFWSWAKTDWTGKNTGNACALLDANGDNKVDQAVCAIVGNGGGKPGDSVNQVGTPVLYDCNNHFSDRCGNPAPVAGAVVAGGVAGSSPLDATGNLITDTDPWVANGPNSTIEVQIDKAHLTAQKLLNVCSYPSNGNGGNNAPFDCVVDLGSSIGLTKTASSNNVQTGDAVTYTLVATNTGISVLNNVSITDTGFTPAPALTCTINNAGPTVNPPVSLNPGDTLNCTFSHTFNSVPAGGSFTNTATTQGTDSTGKTVSATAHVTVAVAAAATGTVTVTKHVTGAAPLGGGTFDIDVTCGGTTTHMHLAANGTQNVTGLAPNTSCSATETGAQGADSTTYTLDTVNYTAGSSFTVAGGAVRDVVVTNHYNGGTVHVTKTVTGTPPAGLGNFDIDVTCNGAVTHLHVAGGGSADVTGIPDASSCNAAEVGSQGATSTNYTLDGANYTAGTAFSVANNATHTVAVTNDYFVAPAPPAPAGSPNLGVTKTSVPASGSIVKPGDQVVYTLSYANTGTAAASGVVATDPLPADLDYVAGSASNGGTYDAASRTITWQLGSLAAGVNGTVTFTGQVASTATNGEVLRNVAVLAAPGINDASNPDAVTVTVPTGALTITKAVDKTDAGFGDTLTYTVKVGATGDVDQSNVVVTDSVPDKTSYVDGSASCAAPCTASESNGLVTWDVGSLAAGTSKDLTFQVTVDTPASAADGSIPAETVHNVAEVSSDDDPGTFSNRVDTNITAVLGITHHRRTPQPEPSPLPFTGLPLLQLLMMAGVAIGGGLLLVQTARIRRAVTDAATTADE